MKTLINTDYTTKEAASRLESALVKHLLALRKNPKNDAEWKAVQDALQNAIVYVSITAYNSGCADVGVRPRMADLIRLRLHGEARAKWVANEMEAWTLSSLDIKASSKKKKLLGKDRARVVVDNESRTAFFNGKMAGWKQNKKARKEWLVSSEHDRDDSCDDNQDDGIIDMGEPFTTGDMMPPAHINCKCSLWLHLN